MSIFFILCLKNDVSTRDYIASNDFMFNALRSFIDCGRTFS
jgi:hypothetical protein